MTSIIEERRDRGIVTLDEFYGEKLWRPRIEVVRLDLRCGKRCVVGQVMGTYQVGIQVLIRAEDKRGLAYRDFRGADHWAVNHGFLAPPERFPEDMDKYWQKLQDAWVRELELQPV